MNNERDNATVEVDLKTLFFELWKKKWWILMVSLLTAIIGFVYTSYFVRPTYNATTRIYILNNSSTAGLNSGDLQTALQLTSDYEQLITGVNVTQKVAKELGMKSLPGRISVTSPENTRILNITVTDTNPERAANIANTVRKVASEQIVSIMNIDAVNTVYEAQAPTTPAAPNIKKNTILAFAAGLILMCAAVIIVFLADDTIKSQEDIEKFLQVSTLGVIPVDVSQSKNKNSGKRNSGNRRKRR